jgi:hypothetical protein
MEKIKKPSQNSLSKADTCVRSVAKGRIWGLVLGFKRKLISERKITVALLPSG